MPALERNVVVKRGALFWEADGEVMFDFVMDGSSRLGARIATDQDKADHAKAYAEFLDGLEEVDVLKPTFTTLDPEVKPAPAPKPYAERRRAAAEAD